MLLYSLCKCRGNHLLSFTKVRLFLSSLTPLGIIYSFENSLVSSSRLWTPGFGQFTSFISFIWGWCLPVPICPPVHKASQKRCLRSLMESWPQPDKTTLGLIREETASQVFSTSVSHLTNAPLEERSKIPVNTLLNLGKTSQKSLNMYSCKLWTNIIFNPMD